MSEECRGQVAFLDELLLKLHKSQTSSVFHCQKTSQIVRNNP